FGIRQERPKGLDILRETEAKVDRRGVGDPEAIYKIAQAYAVLGDKSSALRVLARSVGDGFFSYPYIVSYPLLNSLHNYPKFNPILASARERHEKFRRAFS